MLAAAFPLTRALAAQGVSSPLTILIAAAVAAPIYLVALRLLSPKAWSDLWLLVGKVLLRGERRRKPRLALDGSAAPTV